MLRTSIGSATALVAFAGAAFAQPPGITPEMIVTALPSKGRRSQSRTRTRRCRSRPSANRGSSCSARRTSTPSPRATRCPSWSGATAAARSTPRATGGFLVDDRLARLRGARHGSAGRRGAAAGDGRRSARRRRLGVRRSRPRRLAAERQDRHGPIARHGSVVRRLSLGRARCRSARRHDRRVQLGRAAAESECAGQLRTARGFQPPIR